MEQQHGIFRAGLALAIALVLASLIGAWTLVHVKESSTNSIQVTGSAKRRIRSDVVVWQVDVTASGAQLQIAYRELAADVAKVRAYLIAHGVAEQEIAASAISTGTSRQRIGDESEPTGPVIAYHLGQHLEVRSRQVEKLTAISRSVTELINQGMFITSRPPQYLYTRLGELKVEILADAARDAAARAQQIVGGAGNRRLPALRRHGRAADHSRRFHRRRRLRPQRHLLHRKGHHRRRPHDLQPGLEP